MWFDLMEKLNLICHTIKQPKEKTFIDKIAEFDFKEKLYIKYSAYKMREDIGLYRGKSATTDEWLIYNEAFKFPERNIFKPVEKAMAETYNEVKIADCDEVRWL